MQEPGGKEKVGVIIVGEPGPEEDGPPGKKRRADEVDQAVDRLGGAIDIEPETKGRAQAGDEEISEPEKHPRSAKKKKRGSLKRRIGLWLAAYSLVAILYLGFFSYPVPPAHLNGFNYTVNEKVLQVLPYTYEIDYVSPTEQSVVVVLTIRTIQIPDKAYSSALRNAESITEDYLRSQYGVSVDVRYTGQSSATVEGHSAVRQDYDVYKTITGPLGHSETRLVARMSMLAWFCNENFISVAAGFFHRAGAYPAITENLQCH